MILMPQILDVIANENARNKRNELEYCKLVIIRHVPIFAIFVSARNDEITYWQI